MKFRDERWRKGIGAKDSRCVKGSIIYLLIDEFLQAQVFPQIGFLSSRRDENKILRKVDEKCLFNTKSIYIHTRRLVYSVVFVQSCKSAEQNNSQDPRFEKRMTEMTKCTTLPTRRISFAEG